MNYYFILLFSMCTLSVSAQTSADKFVSGLDSIRKQLKIPAMSVAASKDGVLFVEKAFGYSDLEHHIKASPATVFRVASVTKTFTSTLIMQLVEEGKLDLNSPVIGYGVDLGNPEITVKNLLTHTSEGVPGSAYQYNGYRYGRLGPIIEKAAGKPFYQLLMENIVLPIHMTSTAPAISLDQYFQYIGKNKVVKPNFKTAFAHLARPYALDNKGAVILSDYLNEFGAFGGLATTAADLLKYSAAIDRNQFVKAVTQQQIFTPNRTTGGAITPYGLGWFVQHYNGYDFYWHYGQTQGESALFVKVPKLKLSLAVLCNSDKLSQPFPLGDGDLFTSPVGQLFYRCFVGKNLTTDRSFHNKELIAGATMALIDRDSIKAQHIYKEYARINFDRVKPTPSGDVIALIKDAGVNSDLSKKFALNQPTKLNIYGVGENCSTDLATWCDYGWIEDSNGKLVWQMQAQPATSAGGAIKNQKVEQVISLPAGNYVLRYKSDSAHAFNSWDSLPPDNFFWGIILFRYSK